ncbi:hypothetical protein [Enterobacter sp. BNK-8]|uniref:hypothetical protein n=1 Tax=Enterobacter sp. BNK-8 TaxID=3376145 RepID=UPI003B50A8E2
MRFLKIFPLLTFVAVALSGCDNNRIKKQNDFAFVDLSKSFSSSEIASQEKERIDSIIRTMQDVMDKSNKEYDKLSPEKAEEARKADAVNMRSFLEQSKHSARLSSLKVIQEEIEKMRTESGYSVILLRSSIVSADEQMDMTNALVKRLKGLKVDYGEMPAFTLKNPTE